MGLSHEHTRTDRDEYLEIFETRINPKFARLIEKRTISDKTEDLPYDYGSIMHAKETAYTLFPDSEDIEIKRTMRALKDHDHVLGQRDALSDLDIEKIKLLYP